MSALTDSQMAVWEGKNSYTAHELTSFAEITWSLNKNFKKEQNWDYCIKPGIF